MTDKEKLKALEKVLEQQNRSVKKVFKQLLIVCTAFISALALGIVIGWLLL